MRLTASLIAHPATHNTDVRTLRVEVELHHTGMLEFRYVLDADMSRIRVTPFSGKPSRTDCLWKGTCFEAFVGDKHAVGYVELNFSPSLDWAVYRFGRYRDEISLPEIGSGPKISVNCSNDLLELRASVSADHLPELGSLHPARILPAAVVEDSSGGMTYWALRHRSGPPDFHIQAAEQWDFGLGLT